MTTRRTSRSLAVLAAGASLLAFAAPVHAKGGAGGGGGGTGGGGGGTTVTAGSVKRTSAAAVCTGGTSMTVTVQKGNANAVERVLDITGATAGWWDLALTEDASGRGLVVSGTSLGDLTGVTARITTSTGSRLVPGTYDLTFQGSHYDATGGTLVETCTAHLTVQVA